MTKIRLALSIFALFLVFTACKKTNTTNSTDKTVAALSNSYKITAINVNALGLNFDEYATLEDCQKDNIVKLNTDLTSEYIDAGVACAPPEGTSGNWALSSNSDSITVSGVPAFPTGLTAFIKTWDGTTLVLTETQLVNTTPTTTTLTLYKQ